MESTKEKYFSRTAILVYLFVVITAIFFINEYRNILSDSMSEYLEYTLYISMISWNLSLIIDKRKK